MTANAPAGSALLTESTGAAITDTRALSYIDFTTKTAGAAPAADDPGTLAAIRYSGGLSAPAVNAGKLVAVPNADAQGADYWQIPLGGNGKRIGVEFTVASNDGGLAGVCIALWDHDYNVGVAPVPQARAHVVIVPGGGSPQWVYWVCDGAGHLVTVTSGYFTAPAYDDTAAWRVDVMIDEDTGNACLWLPDDTIVVVTAAQIAATIAATAGWTAGTTLKSLSGLYAVLEHFAGSHSSTTAVFAKFTGFWAEVKTSPRSRRTASPAAIVRAIQQAKGGVDPAWIAPPLTNNWANTAGQPPAGYRKIGNNQVEVRGYMSGGTAGQSAFTLPVGYRPAYVSYRSIYGGSVTVNPAGQVIPNVVGTWLDGTIIDLLP